MAKFRTPLNSSILCSAYLLAFFVVWAGIETAVAAFRQDWLDLVVLIASVSGAVFMARRIIGMGVEPTESGVVVYRPVRGRKVLRWESIDTFEGASAGSLMNGAVLAVRLTSGTLEREGVIAAYSRETIQSIADALNRERGGRG